MPTVPLVVFETPDHERWRVYPGGLIGRMAQAALRLDHPGVSEAHALVSLRGSRLKLLALRGGLQLRGRPVQEIELEEGQEIQLTPDLALQVLELRLPEASLVVEIPGPRFVRLVPSEMSIVLEPDLKVVPGYRRDAIAWLLWDGVGTWLLQVGEEEPVVVQEIVPTRIGAHEVRFLSLPMEGVAPTFTDSRLVPPLEIELRGWRDGREWVARATFQSETGPTVTFGGQPALILWGLHKAGGGQPVRWDEVSTLIWHVGAADPKKWSTYVSRARKELALHRLPDLIWNDGRGLWQLKTRQEDVLRVL